MSNVVPFRRAEAISKYRDSLGDKEVAQDQALTIQDYYHKRGFDWVKVWVDTYRKMDGSKDYYVRSNLVFRVPSL